MVLNFGKREQSNRAGSAERSAPIPGQGVVDPLQTKISYLVDDKRRVPDKALADELREILPELSLYQRELVELKIFQKRHPEINLKEALGKNS